VPLSGFAVDEITTDELFAAFVSSYDAQGGIDGAEAWI
jgi:hypothetical protein